MRSLTAQSRRGRASAAKPPRRGARSTAGARTAMGVGRRAARPMAFAAPGAVFAPASRCASCNVALGLRSFCHSRRGTARGGYVTRAGNAARSAVNAVTADAASGLLPFGFGNRRTDPGLLAALGFGPGESIFAAEHAGARAHLLSLEWVADAEVRRHT